MPDVALDTNVLVGMFDGGDSLHAKAMALAARLQAAGDRPVLLDVVCGPRQCQWL